MLKLSRFLQEILSKRITNAHCFLLYYYLWYTFAPIHAYLFSYFCIFVFETNKQQ
ncbi:hypothetical protein SAMN06264346_10348 [Chryseobacterium profundimaris]|uniref:Uncharacterized protein n=1 Tax=Chryseobacterium profundimaris TaxID=1387275 RepID=A0ABY1NQ91_9FLAO|nr:hypothetical protein SAMN06264346_10348 [Chryseobacterium profundimaris]